MSNQTTLQDEKSPACCLLTQADDQFHTFYIWSHTLVSTPFRVRWKRWQRSYSVMRAPVAKTCPGKAVWGEEAEIWGMERSCEPPRGEWRRFQRVREMARLAGASDNRTACSCEKTPQGWGQDWHTQHSCSSKTHARIWQTNTTKHSGYSLNTSGPWCLETQSTTVISSVWMRLPMSKALKPSPKTAQKAGHV